MQKCALVNDIVSFHRYGTVPIRVHRLAGWHYKGRAMNTIQKLIAAAFITGVITACSDPGQPVTAQQTAAATQATLATEAATGSEEFKGKIAKKYEDSQEWWPEETRPKEGAPNVIIFLLDDVGFAQVGSFGGLIETPNIDQLACAITISTPRHCVHLHAPR